MKILGFLASGIIGLFIGTYLLPGAAGSYVSILVAYHLFLAFLIYLADRKQGLSLTIPLAVIVHLVVLGFLVGIAFLHNHLPLFGFISFFAIAFAPVESHWFFPGSGFALPNLIATAELPALPDDYVPTDEDQEAFKSYLRQKDRPFRKNGFSIEDEFRLWLANRPKN
ncbi:MAG TPA: hypothetical protein VMV57_13100 [Terracidiphilus sp.]|nr:hypothetical protein [Terracidiphilus sp.]